MHHNAVVVLCWVVRSWIGTIVSFSEQCEDRDCVDPSTNFT